MVLRNILLHIDASPACEGRVDLALAIAKQHGASVTGLSIITHAPHEPRRQVMEQQTAEQAERFRQRGISAGVPVQWRNVEWEVVGVGMAEVLIRQSYSTDLVIVGQSGGPAQRLGVPADLPQRLLLGSGRPVLVVPHAGRFHATGSRILVAWKEGREATRALSEALPLLTRATTVRLLTVAPADPAGQPDPWEGVREYLGRHGVHVETELVPTTATPLGDLLLNRVCDEEFDLLVMGAFAHSSQGGVVLGTVAAQILREMTVPVLMAH